MKNKVFKVFFIGLTVFALAISPLIAKADYNGTSSSSSANTSGGGGSFVPINDLDIGSQAVNFSLYFLMMPVELLGTTDDKIEARNEYWTIGFDNAESVGASGIGQPKEVIVSRDGFKKAGKGINSAFSGNIASTLGGGGNYVKKPLRTGIKGNLISVNCSEIGLSSDDFPIVLHSLNGKSVPQGKDSNSYFMTLNPNYVKGETPYAFVNDNMKNLLRFIAGVDPVTGLANLSFEDDPEELTVGGITYKKNHDSIYDRGYFKGQRGEFRLFIEAGLVANSTFYTARELATEAYKETQAGKSLNKTVLYSIKPTFGNALGNFFLTEDDAFNLKGATKNMIPYMNTREAMEEFRLKEKR